MPIPLIPILIAAAVAVAAAIAVRKLLKKFEGKTIMVAGRVRSGKTVLSYYLAESKKPSTVPDKQTPSNKKHASDYKTIDGKNKITAIVDCRHHERATSSEKDSYDNEIRHIQKSDIVLYLCDLNEILKNPSIKNGKSKDYRDATKAEIDTFEGFCEEFGKPLILVGTHLYKIKGFDNSKDLKDNVGLINLIKEKYNFPKEIIPVALTDKYIEESAKAILEKAEQYI